MKIKLHIQSGETANVYCSLLGTREWTKKNTNTYFHYEEVILLTVICEDYLLLTYYHMHYNCYV